MTEDLDLEQFIEIKEAFLCVDRELPSLTERSIIIARKIENGHSYTDVLESLFEDLGCFAEEHIIELRNY